MSAVARVALPSVAPAAPAPRTGYLRLVPQRRSRARRAPFVAVVVALLAGGLLGLLALNTVLAQDAFTLHELQVEGKELADREQALLTSVEALQAPRALAERAQSLGMVPAGPPAFLRLPDGAVLGQGAAAQAPTPELQGDAAVPPVPAAVEQAETAPRAESTVEATAETAPQDVTPTAPDDEVTR